MAALILSLTLSTSKADSAEPNVNGLINQLTQEVETVTQQLQAELLQKTGDLEDGLQGYQAPELGDVLAETGLSNVLNEGLNSLPLGEVLEPLSDLLCPIVGTVDDAVQPVPVASDVTGILRALVCNLGQLTFTYYTQWEAPNGDLVKRTHTGLLGVPTPLDVDNDPTPDLLGTIDFSLALDSISLRLDRALDQNVPLAASAEVVIDDLGGFADKEMISFGYDQLDSQVPQRFHTQFGIAGLLGGGDPVLDVDITQQGPGDSTDVIGGFFNGSPQSRSDETSFRLAYENSPNATGLLLNMGDPLEAQITTDVTGPVVASLSDNDGAESFNARAAIQDMPRVFNLSVSLASPRIVYTGEDGSGAPQGIDRLRLDVDSTEPIFSRANRLRMTIDGLPSGTEVTASEDGQQVGLVASNPIDSIELFAGSEDEQPGDLPAPGNQGANYIDRAGDPFVLGARIFELEQLTANLGDTIGLSARTAGGPFDLLARVEGLDVDAAIRDLPTVLDLGFDVQTGAITYAGSSGIDDIDLNLASAEPLIASANQVELNLEDVPDAFSLGLAPGGNGLEFASDNPLGLIEAKATSPGAADESGLIGPGEAGAVLRDVGGEFFLFTRLFQMRELGVGLDPITLNSKMASNVFTIDAKVDQEGGGVTEFNGVIDELPSEFSLGLAEGAGTQLTLNGSDPIELVRLNVHGLELLEGADDIKVAIHDLPTEVSVELPESGPLAVIDANDEIGQLRLAAGAGSAALPERSIGGDPVLNDLFGFRDLPGDLAIGVRLSALSGLSVNLDPINITLDQDNALTRKIDLDAAIDSNGDAVNVDGLLDKPGDTTSFSVDLTPGQPTRLIFDNSHNMANFDLAATGLPGIAGLTANFDNLSRRMSICMDPGPACQRPNPNSVARYSGGNVTAASLDFDDHGTHGSGTGQAFRSTLNASIAFDAGAPISIENLRFRNLGFDFVDSNNNHSSNCGSLPRMSIFFDSRGHPFVMNAVRYPPQISLFRIGTDSNPARARNRISRLNGWSTSFPLGCLGGFNQSHAGALSCGGASELRVQTPLGNINILNFLTFNFNVCGGTVSNPQPW